MDSTPVTESHPIFKVFSPEVQELSYLIKSYMNDFSGAKYMGPKL